MEVGVLQPGAGEQGVEHPVVTPVDLALRQRPQVEEADATREGLRQAGTAGERRRDGADERAELWPRVTAAQPRYAGYQRRTRREIPLVVLEPVDG